MRPREGDKQRDRLQGSKKHLGTRRINAEAF